MPPRVIATEKALVLLRSLKAEHGALLLHQSGGCCEGTAPMCFRQQDFQVGSQDILLGLIEDCPVFVGSAAYAYLAACQIVIDVTEGGGDSFSLEAANGVRLTTRSRLFTEAEAAELEAAGPPPRGPEALATTRR
ncbi:MAG: DUF779 domain-containing protein [Chthoniobacter sp.]|nr:DUF779 domain-containing protein [Chthoniobacter sp.]